MMKQFAFLLVGTILSLYMPVTASEGTSSAETSSQVISSTEDAGLSEDSTTFHIPEYSPGCPKLSLSAGEVAYIKGPNTFGKSRNCKKIYCGLECVNGSFPEKNGPDAVKCQKACDGTLDLAPGKSVEKAKGGFSYGYKTYCTVKCATGSNLSQKDGKALCVPACDGILSLAPRKVVMKVNGGFSLGSKTYCAVNCAPGGTRITNGKGDVVCMPKPVCVGTVSLAPGKSAVKVKDGFSYGDKTYCSIKCPKRAKLTHKDGKAVCVPKRVCVGTLNLAPGKSADKIKGGFSYGYKTYCTVKCATGSNLSQKDGKALCVPACDGILSLAPRKVVMKVNGGFSLGSKTYCAVNCAPGGTRITNGKGDVVCMPKPVCVGTVSLAPGKSAVKVKDGFSYGDKTYCSIKCARRAKLTQKDGKAVCAPACVGIFIMAPRKVARKVKGKGFSLGSKTYCAITCAPGVTRITNVKGDVSCMPKPVCVGTVSLEPGKSAHKVMGGFSYGFKTYCAVRCISGSTEKSFGREVTCEMRILNLTAGQSAGALPGGMFTVKGDENSVYGSLNCIDSKPFNFPGNIVTCVVPSTLTLKDNNKAMALKNGLYKSMDGNFYTAVHCMSPTAKVEVSGSTVTCALDVNSNGEDGESMMTDDTGDFDFHEEGYDDFSEDTVVDLWRFYEST